MAKSISPNRIFIVGILVFGVSALLYVGMDQTSSLRYDFEQLRSVGGENRGTGTPTDIKLEQLQKELDELSERSANISPPYTSADDPRCPVKCGQEGCIRGCDGGDILSSQASYRDTQEKVGREINQVQSQINSIKSGAINSVSCLVRASSFIVDTDGNERETKSAFSIISQPVATYNFVDTQTNKETERFKVIPYIQCKTDQTLYIQPSEFGFFVESQNSQAQKVETFNGRGQSNLVTIEPPSVFGAGVIKSNDYSVEYPLMTFEIPVKYILQYLDAGEYVSWQEIQVQANIDMYVKDQEDKVLRLEVPRKVGQDEDIRTWFEVKVNKEDDDPVKDSASCGTGLVRNDTGICVLADDGKSSGSGTGFGAGGNSGTSSVGGTSTGGDVDVIEPVSLVIEFFDYLMTGQYDQLNNVKFYPFYTVGIGGIVILSIFSSRSRNVVYYG